MSSIGRKIIITNGFKYAAASESLRRTWWSDKTLLQVLMDRFELSGILNEDHAKALSQLNYTISRAPEFSNIDMQFPANQSGIFRMKMTVVCSESKKTVQRFFYYFSGDVSKGPTPLTLTIAQQIYDKIIRTSVRMSKRQRGEDENELEDNQQSIVVAQSEDSIMEATMIHSIVLLKQRSELLSDTLNYWTSANAAKLFGTRDDELPAISIQMKMDICKTKAMQSIGNTISIKYLLLRKAYETALENMPKINWTECCKMAIDVLQSAGLETVGDPKTVCKWNRYFRANLYLEMDPNHKLPKAFEPTLFVCYPESKDIINRHYATSLESVSIESFRAFVLDNLIPKLVDVENENLQNEGIDATITKEIVMEAIGLSSLSLSTAHRYINYLGYKYSEQKKPTTMMVMRKMKI